MTAVLGGFIAVTILTAVFKLIDHIVMSPDEYTHHRNMTKKEKEKRKLEKLR